MLQKGQTLIEILVALSIAVVVVTATSIAVLSALSNAEFTKSQSLATQYANQAIELMRAMRNSDYTYFAQLSGNYCMATSCTAITNAAGTSCSPSSDPTGKTTCGQNVDTFIRLITVNPKDPSAADCNSQGAKVTAHVAWSDSKCTDINNQFCHIVTVNTCLSDYQIEPTL